MNRSRSLGFVVLLVTLLCVGSPGVTRAQEDTRPNVLLIVSDDLGWAFYHFMLRSLRTQFPAAHDELPAFDNPLVAAADADPINGHDHAEECAPTPLDPNSNQTGFPTSTCRACQPGNGFQALDVCTPNLDKLAKEGIAFREGYSVAPDCDDARPSIVTGLNRRDVTTRTVGCAKGGVITIPEALGPITGLQDPPKDYATFFAGKWNVKNIDATQAFVSFVNSDSAATTVNANTDEAIGESKSLVSIKTFLKNNGQGSTRKPWFVMWDPKMPHSEYILPTKSFGPCGTGPGAAPCACVDPNNCKFTDLYPAAVTQPMSLTVPGYITDNGGIGPTAFRNYLRSVTYLDARIGELRRYLEDLEAGLDVNPAYDPYLASNAYCANGTGQCGQASGNYAGFWSNTLVIYLTDNGAGMDNSKANFAENGLRTPIIVKAPGMGLTNGVGTFPESDWRRDAIVGSIDVFPTILDFTASPALAFPDARSVKPLFSPTATEQNWRRYFVQQWKLDLTAPVALVDAKKMHPDMTVTGNGRFKLGVKQLNRVPYSVIDVTADPFQNDDLFTNSTALSPPDNPAYPGGFTMKEALKSKICEWQGCERSAVVNALYCDGPAFSGPFSCLADDENYNPAYKGHETTTACPADPDR